MMDFGSPGQGAGRAVAGNVVRRNVFYWTGENAHQVYASMTGWTPGFLKVNGSDYNLFWTPSKQVLRRHRVLVPSLDMAPVWCCCHA